MNIRWKADFLTRAAVVVGLCASLAVSASEDGPGSSARLLRIGATSISDFSASVEHFRTTALAIGEALQRPVQFELYEVRELERLVREGVVDLVFTGAGFFRRMEPHGLRLLATEVSPRMSDPDRTTGTTFLVLKERTDLQKLEDLRGKRLVALAPESFQGYQIGMGEVLRSFPYDQPFFGDTLFVGKANGLDMPKVVDALLAGWADMAFVQACFLEDLLRSDPEKAERLRVVNTKEGGSSACRVSTDLYPGWSVSSLPSMDHASLRTVSALLLSMPAAENGAYWSIAADLRPVDRLFRELRIGPYAYLNEWTARRIWEEYSLAIIVVLMSVVGLMAHAYRADSLVRRRTRELKRAFDEQTRLAEEKRRTEEAMERMQRTVLVGQLSTVFAHELKQPLLSITCYVHGLLRLLDRDAQNPAALRTGIEALQRQAVLCADIVDRVRSYAKIRPRETQPVDIRSIVEHAVDEFRKIKTVPIGIEIGEGVVKDAPLVVADPVDVRLAVFNLLRNAEEACRKTEDPYIDLVLDVVERNNSAWVRLVVKDNGPILTDDVFEHLREPFYSTREDGLGLGLSIIGAIVERWGGSFELRRNYDELGKVVPGLTAQILIPSMGGSHAS